MVLFDYFVVSCLYLIRFFRLEFVRLYLLAEDSSRKLKGPLESRSFSVLLISALARINVCASYKDLLILVE